jgi:mycofactocin precursor
MDDQATLTVTDDEVVAVEDELLVEEISIDGMCGVY